MREQDWSQMRKWDQRVEIRTLIEKTPNLRSVGIRKQVETTPNLESAEMGIREQEQQRHPSMESTESGTLAQG